MGMRIDRWKKGQFGVWFFFFHPVTASDFRNKVTKNEGSFAVGLVVVGLSKIMVN